MPSGSRPADPRLSPVLQEAAKLLALVLAVVVVERVCLMIPQDGSRAAVLWLPNAVVLASMLRTAPNGWPLRLAVLLLAGAATAISTGAPPTVCLTLHAISSAEVLATAIVLHLLRKHIPPRDEFESLFRFGATALGVCVVSGAAAAAAIAALEGGQDPGHQFRVWTLAHASGLLVVTPCLLTLFHAPSLLRERRVTRRAAFAFAMVLATACAVFGQSRAPVLFLIPPTLIWLTLELEVLGAAAGILSVAAIAVGFTVFGSGPVTLVSGAVQRAAVLQLFIVTCMGGTLPVAYLTARRRRLRASLKEARDAAESDGRAAHIAEALARAAQIAAAESEARYRLVAEKVSDAIARFDLEGRFTFLTPSIASVTGWAPEELMGDTVERFIHPDDYPRVRDAIAAIAIGKRAAGLPLEYRFRHRDGRYIWLEVNPQAVRDATGRAVEFVDVARDITDRKALEARLAASEELHRQTAETASDVISRVRAGGAFEYVSPAITTIAGWAPEEIVGRTPREFVHPGDIERLSAAFALMITGGQPDPADLEYRFRRKDGGWVWIQSNARPALDPHTGALTYIDVARDVTARHALEAELRQARAEAERAAAVKAEFLANMSHELRTPLTAVLGFSALVASAPELSDASRSHLERVRSAGKALLTTINDILDFSKLEAGQVEITPAPTDVAAVARETLELFAVQAAPKGLSLRLQGAASLPPRVDLDADRLRQVLLNLIGNAVKFTEAGEVALRLSHSDGVLRAEVRDTGCGMDAEGVALLFQRFSQVDASSTRRHGGTGLGLAICKGLVEAMGGAIAVRSTPGEGSVFSFTVRAPRTAPMAGEAASATVRAVRLSGSVLVADDNPANRELARAVLTRVGLQVTEAVDGREALEAAQRQPFDAILLDLRMPVMDGAAAARAIRAGGGPSAGAPLLAFSAEPGGADPTLWSGVVAKPVSFHGLATALERALLPPAVTSQAAAQPLPKRQA